MGKILRKNLLYLALLMLVLFVYVWGASRQSLEVNTDMQSSDQSAYMNYAKKLSESKFKYIGDRNRMPLYPALMALLFDNNMSDDSFFELGKKVGIFIGALVSVLVFFIFKHNNKLLDAVTATLIAIFTVLVYKAAYFQTDVLFYGFSLLLFFLLLSLIENPRLITATLAGLVGGVAHLTKASVLPVIILAAGLLLVRGAIIVRQKFSTSEKPDRNQSLSHITGIYGICVGALIISFLMVITPYIRISKEIFGQYFYNVNSTFYIWYDSWKEVELGTKAHGDRIGWPDMPEDQIPSLRKYLNEHSIREIKMRLGQGFKNIFSTVVHSYGYFEFTCFYFLIIILLFSQNIKIIHIRQFWRDHAFSFLFITGYFVGYLTLYAWYTPIASGNRFVLSLFLPAMLLFVRALSVSQDHNLSIVIFRRRIEATAISPLILLFLIAYLLTVFSFRISTMYAGS